MRLISLSLYGTNPMYVEGVKKNVALAKTIYPGWLVRVYHSGELPPAELEGLDCQLVNMGRSLCASGMFWRFLPVFEKGLNWVIIRDADSRLNAREAAAVAHWQANPSKIAHCMHDHAHHRCLPLFGGMWGIKVGVLSNLVHRKLLRCIKRTQQRGDDMIFLEKFVLPEVQGSLMRHSSVPVKWPGALPFPAHEPYPHFVGRQFDANDNPIC